MNIGYKWVIIKAWYLKSFNLCRLMLDLVMW